MFECVIREEEKRPGFHRRSEEKTDGPPFSRARAAYFCILMRHADPASPCWSVAYPSALDVHGRASGIQVLVGADSKKHISTLSTEWHPASAKICEAVFCSHAF